MRPVHRVVVRWALAALLGAIGLAIAGIAVIAIHDYRVCRSAYDPGTAYFKSTWFAGSRIGNLNQLEIPPLSNDGGPPCVTEIRDGLYHVVSWADGPDESGTAKRTTYECTLECSGLDDWRVIDLKIGDGPVVVLNEELGYTGQINRLWSYRLFGRRH